MTSRTSPEARDIRIAAALILAAGLVAAGLAIFTDRLGVGQETAAGVFGVRRASLLAVGALVTAAGALLLARPRIASRPENWERILSYRGYLAIGLFGVLAVVLVWTRLIHIEESLGHDAAFTALTYIDGGPSAILFGEESFDVNNHVVYNLLSWATINILSASEAVYRLWSVLPAIVAIAVATWWAWRRIGPITAIAFAALAVAAPLHLELASDARGYGLATLAATLMLIAADRLTHAYSKRMFLGFLAAGLLGIWTVFIFAIAFVGQALALLRWPALRRPVIAVVGTAGILSLAFYAPVLRDVLEARALGESIPLGEALVLHRTFEWLAVPSFTLVARTEPAGWMSFGALALVALAIVALWRRGDSGLALILVLPPLLFNLVFGITGLETVDRHQFLLLTHVLLLVAVGTGEVGRIIVRYRPLTPVAIGAGVVAVLLLSQAIVKREQDEVIPRENFKEAASVVRWADIGPIVTDSIRPQGLRYYLGDDLIELSPAEVESRLCEGREMVYIRHLQPAAETGFSSPASLDCLIGEQSVRFRVPQRRLPGAIDVWIVHPRSIRETIEAEAASEP